MMETTVIFDAFLPGNVSDSLRLSNSQSASKKSVDKPLFLLALDTLHSRMCKSQLGLPPLFFFVCSQGEGKGRV